MSKNHLQCYRCSKQIQNIKLLAYSCTLGNINKNLCAKKGVSYG